MFIIGIKIYLSMQLKNSYSKTYNCTEGGIIFEKPIITRKFKDFCSIELIK